LSDFLQDVLFCLKNVLKEKSWPSTDDGWHAGAHVLELLQPHFLRFVGESLKGGAPKDFDSTDESPEGDSELRL
jgi:hypothetical protein